MRNLRHITDPRTLYIVENEIEQVCFQALMGRWANSVQQSTYQGQEQVCLQALMGRWTNSVQQSTYQEQAENTFMQL